MTNVQRQEKSKEMMPGLQDMVMMETKFGSVMVNPAQQMEMQNGPIGFEAPQDYILTKIEQDKKGIYLLLQSIDEKDRAFILLPIDPLSHGYEISDIVAACNTLDIASENARWFVIVNMNNAFGQPEIFANFMAPIIMDMTAKKGWQHVFANPHYEVKKKLL
ncbi:MAG: flagellar assembly protein FliW [Alphaproteobacteria bacterium]|jgi:flagellar assembly factor FliW|nr:flagellar assembly protein FliW [Alphaproteobacteria bacterium]MBP9877585.1 flagellar assembly protein FliW [Alphaproteobacteria bacterium]